MKPGKEANREDAGYYEFPQVLHDRKQIGTSLLSMHFPMERAATEALGFATKCIASMSWAQGTHTEPSQAPNTDLHDLLGTPLAGREAGKLQHVPHNATACTLHPLYYQNIQHPRWVTYMENRRRATARWRSLRSVHDVTLHTAGSIPTLPFVTSQL